MKIFRELQYKLKIKNEAALGRHMRWSPATMSRLRHGTADFGAERILQVHDMTGWSIAKIRGMLCETT